MARIARDPGPTTASCGKLRYTSRAAGEAAAALRAERDDYPDILRVYWHRLCNGYHITSQEKGRP